MHTPHPLMLCCVYIAAVVPLFFSAPCSAHASVNSASEVFYGYEASSNEFSSFPITWWPASVCSLVSVIIFSNRRSSISTFRIVVGSPLCSESETRSKCTGIERKHCYKLANEFTPTRRFPHRKADESSAKAFHCERHFLRSAWLELFAFSQTQSKPCCRALEPNTTTFFGPHLYVIRETLCTQRKHGCCAFRVSCTIPRHCYIIHMKI
jgi:hypothetical protein